MTEQEIKAFLAICDRMDIRKFNSVELGVTFAQLKNEILIGLRRKGQKVRDDGGVEAIDTTIKPVSWEQFKKVKDGHVLYGAYAGTNWITGLAFKLNSSVIEQKLVTKSFFDRKERSFSSRESFAKMVGNQIKEAIDTLNVDTKVSAIAISYGFPQIPKITKYGRDAIITAEHLTKSWYIKNGKGMCLGEYILKYLRSINLGFINTVYFANDTTAVALDVSAKRSSSKDELLISLPVGFVMGTGDNGSAIFKGFKNDNLVNLEIGSASSVDSDTILDEMIKENLVPTKVPIIEYFMGGDYLLARLAVSMKFIQENKITRNNYYQALLKYAKESKITSKLASRDISAEELSELLHLSVKADDLFILNEVAKRILAKGAQVAGVMVASVCDLAGWGKGIYGAVPVEGTVFWQGYRFQERVKKTLKTLLPYNKLTFVPGSGTRGIATEAMINTYK